VTTKGIRYYKTERVGALSDGVFAIVLTLLVLELRMPEQAEVNASAWSAVHENWHELAGWIVSFIVLARMWAIHHDTFASLKRVSSQTILINFIFLATISLIPFAAKFVGFYEFSGPSATIVFSTMLALTGITLGWVISAAEADARLHRKLHEKWSWRVRHHLLLLPAVAGLAILGALLHPALGLVILSIEAIVAIVILFSSGEDSELESESAR
jgi:uncharacterized membrane protein